MNTSCESTVSENTYITVKNDMEELSKENIAEEKIDDENIRVLIKNSNYNNIFHADLSITCQSEICAKYENDSQTYNYNPGHVLEFISDQDYSDLGKITIFSTDNAPIQLNNLKRSDSLENQVMYSGSLDIYCSENGFVVVNELLFSDYLKKVVPSEMPAKYPGEALKAQAICARTYALKFNDKPAYPEYNAWLDDSTSFQVYNNMPSNEMTDIAVENTRNLYLVDTDKNLADVFYYSTSAGLYDFENYDSFEKFINCPMEDDYEKGEEWYRWKGLNLACDAYKISERISVRQEENPSAFYIYDVNEFINEYVPGFNEISDMAIVKRSVNGAVEELNLWTDAGTFKITGEYNIRYVLGDKAFKFERENSSDAAGLNILPSGFFYLETRKEKGSVVEFSIYGGGLGHGNGLSQNGAKNLAYKGMNYEEILNIYFPDCSLHNIN